MIHRGTVGSMERVVAALLEHYQGRLPFWLAPVQLAIVPVTSEQDAAARQLLDGALARGLRAQVLVSGSLGSRLRAARVRRDHLVGVVGAREAGQAAVRVTDAGASAELVLPCEELLARMEAAHRGRHAHISAADDHQPLRRENPA